MSDRLALVRILTNEGSSQDALVMYRDGESGTWRLFLKPNGEDGNFECVDFSLEGLKSFHQALIRVLADIEKYPDMYDAEVRQKVEATLNG